MLRRTIPAEGDGIEKDNSMVEEEDEEEEANIAKEDKSAGGFHSFAPKLKANLFRINPLSTDVGADVDAYLRGGSMTRDLVYIRTLYGLVNPSQKREFSFFWESPWVEEHIKDTSKKRKVEEQQKSLAVRTYIRASSTTASVQQEPEDLDKFLTNVSKLTDWEDKSNSSAKETVKTVSRVVQSFEKKAVRNILNLLESGNLSKAQALNHLNRLRGGPYGDISDIAHTLRRSTITYDAFANLVAAEILFSDGTNGSRNTSIHLSKRLDFERQMSAMTLIEVLHRVTAQTLLPKDALGLPLMQTDCRVCVSNGVLVVCGDSAEKATYILNIHDEGKLDEILKSRSTLSQQGSQKKRPNFIEISAQVYTEEDEINFQNKKSLSRPSEGGVAEGGRTKKTKISAFTSLI